MINGFKVYRRYFEEYRRCGIEELRPWQPGDDMTGVHVSVVAKEGGSPKAGDMIQRHPKHHDEQWLVTAQDFADSVFVVDDRDERVAVAVSDLVDAALGRQRLYRCRL